MPFDIFLDREAVREADDRFYKAHPEFLRKDGSRMLRTWCLGRSKKLKSEWYGYYRTARDAWIATEPRDFPDDVDPVQRVKICPITGEKLVCEPITSVKLTSVTYLNKFVLHDEWKYWAFDGVPPLPDVDWTPDMDRPNPVAVAFHDAKALSIRLTYEVGEDAACPQEGLIQAPYKMPRDKYRTLAYRQERDVPLSPGREHVLEPEPFLTFLNRVGVSENEGEAWEAHPGEGGVFHMGRSKNDVYGIFGRPKQRGHTEDGPTAKRMYAAVTSVQGAKTASEFKCIEHLFNRFGGYVLGIGSLSPEDRKTLEDDPELYALMQQAGWPSYHTEQQDDEGGAWAAYDFRPYSAECQAICRHVRGVMHQLGAESEMELLLCTADFNDPYTPRHGKRATGPNPKKHYALVDSPVEVGKSYPRYSRPGFNHFEAYLKVKSPGMTTPRLFGGGMGLVPEGFHPLSCFSAIVEFEDDIVQVEVNGQEDWEWRWKITDMVDYKAPGAFQGWDGVVPRGE